MHKPRLLFISHDATRTGAVIQLRDLLRWLYTNSRHEITTLLLGGGELAEDFAAFGPVVKAYAAPEATLASRALRKVLGIKPPSALDRAVAQLRRQPRFDLLYANTTVAGVAMGALHGLARRRIAHVHEMPTFIASLDPRSITAIREYGHKILVPSVAVGEGLCLSFGFEPERIAVRPGFVRDPPATLALGANRGQHLRQLARLPLDAWVMGVCGGGALLKGSDLLPRLAQALPKRVAGRPVHLVHLGQFGAARDRLFIARDAQLLGAADRLHLLGVHSEPWDIMAGFDLHLLPSREDSFPLVVLEAAAVEVPTICFEGAGGAMEFCANGAGVTVPYLDVDVMAGAAAELLNDPERRRLMGATARAKWMQGHRIETAMPQWLEIVERELALAAQER